MDKNDIIKRIDDLLDERGITKNSLMNNAEISTIVYQWKSNRSRDKARTPSLNSIMKICKFFNISLSYFFAEDRTEELNSKQKETSNKLLELTENELDAINIVIDTFIMSHIDKTNGE